MATKPDKQKKIKITLLSGKWLISILSWVNGATSKICETSINKFYLHSIFKLNSHCFAHQEHQSAYPFSLLLNILYTCRGLKFNNRTWFHKMNLQNNTLTYVCVKVVLLS